MSTMTALTKAKLPERNLVKRYLEAVVENCASESDDSSFQIISNNLVTGIAYKSRTNIAPVSERLKASATVGIIAYRQGLIHTVTSAGLTISPLLEVIKFNPKLLRQALKQEEIHDASDANTADPRAWTGLPKIIQLHWGRFNDILRTHIMKCMMEFLKNQTNLHSSHSYYAGTLFAAQRKHPHIPIVLHADNKSGRPFEGDLMDALVSVPRASFSQLMPGEKGEELKIQFNFKASTPTS